MMRSRGWLRPRGVRSVQPDVALRLQIRWQPMERLSETMTEIPDDAALALEFDVFAKRAGLEVPADRKAVVFAGFKELRQMLALLRQPRTAAAEPAGTYAIQSVTRGIG